MNPNSYFPLVEVTRGNVVESIHYGSLAIAQPDGRILFSLGEPTKPVFLRSGSKPFQALPLLEAGGAERFGLTPQEIAIICSSHSGTDEHVKVLENLQKKIGIQESMLQCGVHVPFHAPTAQAKMLKGEAFHPNQNACSGKHSGMLAYAKMLAASMDDYLENSHPVQQAILRAFAEMCQIAIEDIQLGTDGCSAPVFAVPLANSATAFARLCQPDGLPKARTDACRTITSAMTTYPNMIGGPGRFDTDIMTAGRGSLVSKMGAEGFQGIGVMPGKTAGFKSSLGITIKIIDGDPSLRAGCLTAVQLLKHLQVLTGEQIQEVQAYYSRPLYNWRKTRIGEIRPSAELLEALAQFQL